MKRLKTLRERLLVKAIVNWETGCWEWSASRDSSGYGSIKVNGSWRGAHRIAYELIEGPIPAGLQLDHLCRVRHCVNPAHLEPVTPRENTMRSPIAFCALNAQKTFCKHGHEFTPGNTYINAEGRRTCRACQRAAVARYQLRRKARNEVAS
jgi:hypothetical protein